MQTRSQEKRAGLCLLRSYTIHSFGGLYSVPKETVKTLCVLFQRGSSPAKRELNSRANPFRPMRIYPRETDPVEVWTMEPVWWADRGLLSPMLLWTLSPGANSLPKEKQANPGLDCWEQVFLLHLGRKPKRWARSGQKETSNNSLVVTRGDGGTKRVMGVKYLVMEGCWTLGGEYTMQYTNEYYEIVHLKLT